MMVADDEDCRLSRGWSMIDRQGADVAVTEPCAGGLRGADADDDADC
mgnify:FL=1|jgi:hypothetical protein